MIEDGQGRPSSSRLHRGLSRSTADAAFKIPVKSVEKESLRKRADKAPSRVTPHRRRVTPHVLGAIL